MIEYEHIHAVIASYFGFEFEELKNAPQEKPYNYPNQLFAYFADALPDSTLSKIGEYRGRDHSAIAVAKNTVANWLKVDPSVRKDVNAIWVLLQKPTAFTIIQDIIQQTPPEKMEELTQVFINWKNQQL